MLYRYHLLLAFDGYKAPLCCYGIKQRHLMETSLLLVVCTNSIRTCNSYVWWNIANRDNNGSWIDIFDSAYPVSTRYDQNGQRQIYANGSSEFGADVKTRGPCLAAWYETVNCGDMRVQSSCGVPSRIRTRHLQQICERRHPHCSHILHMWHPG